MKYDVNNILDTYIDLMVEREIQIEKNLFMENKFNLIFWRGHQLMEPGYVYVPVLDTSITFEME